MVAGEFQNNFESSSSSRRTASHAGFFDLSQSGERPERYVDVLRFDTMPSRPILHAWANTVGSSASMCSLSPHWLKIKNPHAPAVTREADEDWRRPVTSFPQPSLSVRFAPTR